MLEREKIVLEFIKNFPKLHHNSLLKMIVPKFMAKTTFEKTRDSLLEKRVISAESVGNKRVYTLTLDYEKKSMQHMEQITNIVFHNLKIQIKKLDTDYQHKGINEKIHIVNSLLKNILQTDVGFTILNAIKDSKKSIYHEEHKAIQQLINDVFNTIQQDRDHDTVYPIFMSCLNEMIPKEYQENK